MGMYFNTAATTEMNQKVNDQFGSNIDYWRDPQRRNQFDQIGSGGKLLSLVAGGNGIYPSAGANSPVGRRWFKWLDDLDSQTNIRKHFFKHLDKGEKCAELIFNVKPKASMPIRVTPSPPVQNADGTYSQTITIETPTAKAVRAAIKRQMKARKKRKL